MKLKVLKPLPLGRSERFSYSLFMTIFQVGTVSELTGSRFGVDGWDCRAARLVPKLPFGIFGIHEQVCVLQVTSSAITGRILKVTGLQ